MIFHVTGDADEGTFNRTEMVKEFDGEQFSRQHEVQGQEQRAIQKIRPAVFQVMHLKRNVPMLLTRHGVRLIFQHPEGPNQFRPS